MVEIISDGMGQPITAAFTGIDETLAAALTAQALSLPQDTARDVIIRWHTEVEKLGKDRLDLESGLERDLDAKRLAQLQSIQSAD